MAKEKKIDWEMIEGMDADYQAQVYYALAKRLNQRKRDIKEKSKLHSHAADKVEKWLMETYGTTTFKQTKAIYGVELKENLEKIKEFFDSTSSSAKGIRDTQKKREKTLKSKLEKAEQKKFGKIMKDPQQQAKFYEFLNSRQYQQLIKEMDSDQLIEDLTRAMDSGFTLDDIMAQYETFLNTEMTFEQVEEMRQKAIKEGRYLH